MALESLEVLESLEALTVLKVLEPELRQQLPGTSRKGPRPTPAEWHQRPAEGLESLQRRSWKPLRAAWTSKMIQAGGPHFWTLQLQLSVLGLAAPRG